MVWGGLRTLEQRGLLAEFRPTVATVTHAAIDTETYEVVDTENDTSEQVTRYSPRVEFTYVLDGVEHANGAYAPEASVPSLTERDEAQALLVPFAEAGEVPAWYLPRDPPVAYVERGSLWDRAGPLWIGLGILFGLPFFIWLFLLLPPYLNRRLNG